nr:uncharacterized protein LOC113402354 [Vanessa tameamea]
MNSNVYRWRAVPQCNNTSIKTPKKLFINVPLKKKVRNMWLNLARRDPTAISSSSVLYFCEDHFDLLNDMENYIQYLVMGSVSQMRMKSGCMPTRFECQSDRRKRTSNTTERPYVLKKQRRILIKESEKDFAEKIFFTYKTFRTCKHFIRKFREHKTMPNIRHIRYCKIFIF